MSRYARQKVLLFDDDEHNITRFKMAMRDIKVHSVRVSRVYQICEENIKLLADADVIFVHWRAGSNAARSLCQALRYSRKSPNPFLPIIMISQEPTRQSVETARNAGVDEFLAAPYSVKTVEEHLRSVVDNRRGFVRVEGYFGPDRRRGAMAQMLGQERRGDSVGLIDPRTGIPHVE